MKYSLNTNKMKIEEKKFRIPLFPKIFIKCEMEEMLLI